VRAVRLDPPAELGVHEGLAYALFLPRAEPSGGVVVLHGAGSCKENHYDVARVLRAQGMAAVVFDQRGHGASEGPMDGRAIDDVAAIAGLLPPGPRGLRGSSMGGYLALVSAQRVGASAIVAICPASAEGLVRGLRAGRFEFAADGPELEALMLANDAAQAIAALDVPVMLMHAEGDLEVPVEHSRALHAAAPNSRLIVTPGGHHRSIQHDDELQSTAGRFLRKAFRAAGS
jgi:pimeloyl-ACP methyl ester carboxylesterase